MGAVLVVLVLVLLVWAFLSSAGVIIWLLANIFIMSPVGLVVIVCVISYYIMKERKSKK